MKIKIAFTPLEVEDHLVKDATVVVIDVLRASSSITTALRSGAREVIPAATVEAALKLRMNLASGNSLLCGERNGKIIEGFDLGNSPAEYTTERVQGKTIITTTTNGTVAIAKSKNARAIFIGSFVNLDTIVQGLLSRGSDDVVLVCSGKENTFSLEDTVCAGMMISRLSTHLAATIDLTDGAKASKLLFEHYDPVDSDFLFGTEHGSYLSSLGFGNDLKICGWLNSVPVLPMMVEPGVLKLTQIEQ